MAVALISMRPIRSFHRAEILPFRATIRGYDETFLFSRDEIFDRNRDLQAHSKKIRVLRYTRHSCDTYKRRENI